MRAGAEVDKFALLIKADQSVFWQILNQFYLVVFAPLFKKADGFLTGHLFAYNGIVGFDDIVHFRFYGFEVLGSEGMGTVEIIIEAFIYGRSNRQLSVRPQPFDRLSHDMRRAVAVHILAGRVFKA